MTDNYLQAFYALLKAGLWEKEVRIPPIEEVDFKEVFRLAQEQSVIGLVAAGLEYIIEAKAPKEFALKLAGEVLQIEQRNTAMNHFVGQLVDELRDNGIYALLVKGQGIAQCYTRPLWRTSGDIDLFLSEDNFKKAEERLKPIATSVAEKECYSQHLAMNIGSWEVELHGTLRSGLWKAMDKALDEVQYDIFCGGNVRTWMNRRTHIFLPREDEDVIYVFSHILEHFFKEGIGLRQICDWCRLLWSYKDSINIKLLESRLVKMGVMSEWRAFGALAVNYLGMPVEDMPFYSADIKLSKKAKKIMVFVIETGNFGHNRDYTYQSKYPFYVYKAISLWKHLKDGAFLFSIFPIDSIKVTWRRIMVGMSVVLKFKKHE